MLASAPFAFGALVVLCTIRCFAGLNRIGVVVVVVDVVVVDVNVFAAAK